MATATDVMSHTRSQSTNLVINLTSPNTTVSSGKRVHREVRFGAYVLGSTLGEGEFGKVKLGWRKDGKHPSQVAIKLIKRDSILKDLESEIKIHREINSLRLLNHPNIVNLVEVLKSGKYIGIVLEYASGGELFDYILQHKYLKENVAKKLFAQLVSGVDYMHLKGLIHRDLKLENLLLDKHKNIIISDFGFVNSYNRDRNDLMKTSCGSPCYAAPELVLTQLPYSGRKVDIWSLGVILYAMLSGYLPFDDDAENEDGADIVRLYNYICSTPLTFPEYVSPLARDLLRKIIVSDPEKRISMNEIRAHPWLAPHANLLSIRQPEWDRLHSEEKGVLMAALIMNNKQKRYSMFSETTSSSTLMLSSTKNMHGRSYTSNANIIYSNPTTSSSFANVVALTNSKEPNLAASASSVNTSSTTLSSVMSNAESGSPSKLSQYVFQRGHSKSASMSANYPSASRALKAVATEHDNKRKSLILESDLPTHSHHALPPATLPRSTTYTGTISTIVESPTNADFSIQRRKDWLERSADTSADLAREMVRLPHSEKKPRPTSYHPGSMTSSLLNGSSALAVLDYVKIATPNSIAVPQFLSGSPAKSTVSIDSTATDRARLSSPGPQTSVPTRRSATRRDSVVTAINVNGVLTSDLNSHENKRNSVLSYLEDKMDALELTELHSPSRVTSVATLALPAPILKLDTELPPPQHHTPQIDQLPTFATATESPKEKVVVKEQITEKKPSKEETAHYRTRASADIARRERNKENQEAKEAKKRNRFSILSFYSNSNASATIMESASVNSSGRKVLEPSNEANIQHKEQKRIGSSSLGKSAQLRKSIAAGTANGAYVNGKEASAARKVMNFFKRRSVRI